MEVARDNGVGQRLSRITCREVPPDAEGRNALCVVHEVDLGDGKVIRTDPALCLAALVSGESGDDTLLVAPGRSSRPGVAVLRRLRGRRLGEAWGGARLNVMRDGNEGKE